MFGVGRIVARRGFSTAQALRFHVEQEAKPLANMPFKATNRYRFTIFFALFCASGFSAPFLMVRHQLLKK